MTSAPYLEIIPIKKDADEMIRVGGTRVTLQTIVYAFRRGDSSEQIVDSYSALQLADVYAFITYYLNHRDEVDAYVREREQLAEAIRQENEARFPSEGLRARQIARMEAKRQSA